MLYNILPILIHLTLLKSMYFIFLNPWLGRIGLNQGILGVHKYVVKTHYSSFDIRLGYKFFMLFNLCNMCAMYYFCTVWFVLQTCISWILNFTCQCVIFNKRCYCTELPHIFQNQLEYSLQNSIERVISIFK
jgi:hypothetical protein